MNYDVGRNETFQNLATHASKIGVALPLFLMKRVALALGTACVLLLVVGFDFARATTFFGDDYLFRAFARLEPTPLVAFVRDKHGGEYYRPLPMLVWWVLERVGRGGAWPFAALGFVLHATCACVLGVLVSRLASVRVALLAAALFLVAPAAREAALWFSASTDLLATAAVLGALACSLSERRAARVASLVLAALAYLSKETALVLPLMVASLSWYLGPSDDRQAPRRFRQITTSTLPFVVLALAYLGARFAVLGGLGGSNDVRAPPWAELLQILGGLLHAVSAYAPLPEWAALLLGAASVAVAGAVVRRARLAGLAGLWLLATVLPLPAAGWLVGARYFYLASAPLMVILALALARARAWLPGLALVALLALGTASAYRRAADVRLYRQTVAAAVDAVNAGVGQGRRLFLLRGAVKDVDLAIKLDPAAAAGVAEAVVIPDVPASFVWLPPARAAELAFLLADPPLPPSGAYSFGPARLVGLARRDEAPDLDQVLARLPDLRIIRLGARPGMDPGMDTGGGGRGVGWQDVTADYAQR